MTTYSDVRELLFDQIITAAESLNFEDPRARQRTITELVQLCEAYERLVMKSRNS